MAAYWTGSRRFKLALTVIGAAWLATISGLMVADVWDETNALLLLESGSFSGLELLEIFRISWSEPIGGVYRPMGASLSLAAAEIVAGDFVLLRYFNALLILCSVSLLARAMMLRFDMAAGRATVFFVVMLFSASSLITATWFANIFDAACLFFLAMAIRLYVSGHLVGCGISFAFAVFCKESYVLAFPLFAWLLWEDLRGQDTRGGKARSWLAVSMVGVSVLYWWSRHSLIPIGSEADLHGFEIDAYAASYASFIAGFPTQSSSFVRGGAIFWAGIAVMIALVVLIRNFSAKFTVLAILGLCGPVYWGMFGYQGDNVMSHHNFVGRLYLIPFALTLFIIFAKASRPTILLIALFSIWGMGVTWRQHFVFQQTYASIYRLAESTEGTLFVHYPEKPLEDIRRNLRIGNFPDAELRINVRDGGLE